MDFVISFMFINNTTLVAGWRIDRLGSRGEHSISNALGVGGKRTYSPANIRLEEVPDKI